MANKYLEKIALNKFEQKVSSGIISNDPRVQAVASKLEDSKKFLSKYPHSHVNELVDLHKDFSPVREARGKYRSALGSNPVTHFKNVGDSLAHGAPSIAKKLSFLARVRG